MNCSLHAGRFEAMLTAGSFLSTLSAWIVAILDALDGSRWYVYDFALGLGCGVSFVSLLATNDPIFRPKTIESGNE